MLGFRGLALNYTEFLILAPSVIFFFNDTATTEIYTLSLHDALPISEEAKTQPIPLAPVAAALDGIQGVGAEDGQRRHLVELGRLHRPLQLHRKGHRRVVGRSEEHTSELQSPSNLVCRLLLEKQIMQAATPSVMPAATQAVTHPASAPVASAIDREAAACSSVITTKCGRIEAAAAMTSGLTALAPRPVIVPDALMTLRSPRLDNGSTMWVRSPHLARPRATRRRPGRRGRRTLRCAD